MQRIRFAVVRDARFRSVDGFHVYGDSGTGTMDWAHPVTPRRILFWEDALPMQPHLLAGHVMGHHLDSVFNEGHLYGTHLLDRHDQPAGAALFEAGPFVFGRFRHMILPMDELGNQNHLDATTYETPINSYPPPAFDLKVSGFDPATGVVTFSFTPSERLIG